VICLAALLLLQAAAPQPKNEPPTVMEMDAVKRQPHLRPQARINGPYTLIPINPGVNRVPNFSPLGEDSVILSSWVDNGNAWGHRRYEVIIPSREGQWDLVSFNDDKVIDGIIEVPHTGEDALSVVRFLWGYENGRHVALVVNASRNPEIGLPEPAETTMKIYSMRVNDEPGTTHVYFTTVKEWTAKRLYCNAEMALHDELGLPLSAGYEGAMKAGGCD
jgi:hypothetical protein